MQKIYPWKRYWVRSDAELTLEDDAYLPDPEEQFSQFLNPRMVTVAQICEGQCSVVLGEPGSGKSRSLHADFAELKPIWATKGETGVLIDLGSVTSLTDLRALLLEDESVRQWLSGNSVMHLGLDSLDEAISTYAGISKGLMTVIQGLPKARVRLLIACRAGEFPPSLHDLFEAYFGDQGVSHFYLAPLTQKDVRLAATENDLDADDVLKAVREREVQPLAARPITLELLLGEARSGADLLPDMWVLYERGCRRLLSERRDTSRLIQTATLEPNQRMAVAGRLACITIFGANTAVDIRHGLSANGGVVAPEAIAGGEETAAGNAFSVTTATVREVLKD